MQNTVSRAFIVVLCLLLLVAIPQWVQASTAEGRQQLFNDGNMTVSGLLAARDTFSEVVDTDPTYQEARAFYAVTHLLAFLFEDGTTAEIETLKELLEAFGLTRTDDDSIDPELFNNLFNELPTFDEAYDPPSTLPNGGDISTFVQGPLLTRLNEVLAALNSVESGFTTTITPQETGDESIEIDDADIQILRSWAYTARSFALIVGAYDLSCNLGDLVQLINADMLQLHRDLLNDTNMDLLSLQDDGATSLQNAAQALQNAITEYTAAHNAIVAEIDDGNWRTYNLFTFNDLGDVSASAFYVNQLEEINASLESGQVANLVYKRQTWFLIDESSGDRIRIEQKIDAENNIEWGEWNGLDGCDFISCHGQVLDFDTDGTSYVTFVLDVNGCGEATFTGSLSGTAIAGTYLGSGCSASSGAFAGSLDHETTYTEVINFNRIFGTNSAPALDIRGVLPEFNAFNEPVIGTFPLDENDEILNGILPSEPRMVTNEDATRALNLMPTGVFSISNGSITIDGSFTDWSGDWKVFDDIDSDDDEETYNGGKDLKSFWMAQDNDYYYMMAVFHDGPVLSEPYPYISFYAKFDPDEGLSPWIWPGPLPFCQVYPYEESGIIRTGRDFAYNSYYGTEEVRSGVDSNGDTCVEWRIPKSDMGDINGRFVDLRIGVTGGNDCDYNPTFVQFSGYAVSGTVSINDYNGGKIFLYLYDGPDPDNSELLASTMIDGPGGFSIENLPNMGDTTCYLFAVWDADGNGIVNFDDIYGSTSFLIDGNVPNANVSANQTIDFSVTGSVMNVHTPDGTYATFLEAYISGFNQGILPDDVDSITYEGPGGILATLDDPNIEITRYSDSEYGFFVALSGSPALGTYTFTVTSGSATRTATDTQTILREIPLPDVTSFYPQSGGTVLSYTPLFAWDPVEYGGIPLYYRLQICDAWGNLVYSTSRTLNMTSNLVPSGILWSGESYYWRVRVTDSGNWVDVENRSHSAWQPFTMAYQLYSDSDGDGLLDDVEDANQNGTVDADETDPYDADSDNDGIIDGLEDWNRNGTVDPGETDPRVVESMALPFIPLLLLGD